MPFLQPLQASLRNLMAHQPIDMFDDWVEDLLEGAPGP